MTFHDGRLIWVSLSYATYGLLVRNGRVVDAPPIARWMIGHREQDAATWLRRKGARFVTVGRPSPPEETDNPASRLRTHP